MGCNRAQCRIPSRPKLNVRFWNFATMKVLKELQLLNFKLFSNPTFQTTIKRGKNDQQEIGVCAAAPWGGGARGNRTNRCVCGQSPARWASVFVSAGPDTRLRSSTGSVNAAAAGRGARSSGSLKVKGMDEITSSWAARCDAHADGWVQMTSGAFLLKWRDLWGDANGKSGWRRVGKYD